MTSEARVAANRRNAEKSTGPRTPEGKAVVAQNAVKHGLLARQAVIKDEDPAEFELYRRQMLDELAPDGPVEQMLAERVVGLSWRLKRAERMQDEALDYLIESDASDSWTTRLRARGDPSAAVNLTLGRVAARDFAEKKTLDRLMMYERRIENSLYKTMSELHKLRLMRDEPAGSACSVPARAYQETPCGVTTNGADSAKQSQSADNPPGPPVETQHLASPPAGSVTEESIQADSDPSCETKPIEPAQSVCSVPARAYSEQPAKGAYEVTPCGVTTNGDTACETKPIGLVVQPAGTGNEAEALAGAGRCT